MRTSADAAGTEREFLLHELAASGGLGHRPRRLGDEAEKVRKTLTARIRHTIAWITKLHPRLGAHLDASVHTGNRCCYRLTEPTTWQVGKAAHPS
jgi:hypothetical protein